MMHTDPVHLAAALASQRVVERQQDRARDIVLNQSKHDQTKTIQGPARASKHAVKRRVMLRACYTCRHQHASYRPLRGQNPAGQDRHELVKRRPCHRRPQGLQQRFKRGNKRHKKPLENGGWTAKPTSHSGRGFLGFGSRQNPWRASTLSAKGETPTQLFSHVRQKVPQHQVAGPPRPETWNSPRRAYAALRPGTWNKSPF